MENSFVDLVAFVVCFIIKSNIISRVTVIMAFVDEILSWIPILAFLIASFIRLVESILLVAALHFVVCLRGQ